MSWPWVSREFLQTVARAADETIRDLRRREAEATKRADDAMRQYHDLAERALAMRKDGFAPIEPPAPPPQEPLPQPVEAAIAERAVTVDLDRHLRRWARQELTARTPEEVARRILEGAVEQEEEL